MWRSRRFGEEVALSDRSYSLSCLSKVKWINLEVKWATRRYLTIYAELWDLLVEYA
jgi:hypothetical protein